MSNRKHQNGVMPWLKAVQRKIAGLAARNDQFPQPMLNGATNQRMVFKDLHGLGDEIHRLHGGDWLSLTEKFGQPNQISKRPLGVDYLRQEVVLGWAADSPRA